MFSTGSVKGLVKVANPKTRGRQVGWASHLSIQSFNPRYPVPAGVIYLRTTMEADVICGGVLRGRGGDVISKGRL